MAWLFVPDELVCCLFQEVCKTKNLPDTQQYLKLTQDGAKHKKQNI